MIKQLVLFLLSLLAGCNLEAQIVVQNLRCEMLPNPEGIDVMNPRLSWEIESNQRATMQTAYQVIVASTEAKLAANDGDLWNPGKITSDASVNVNYEGNKLGSRTECYWKVKVWTNKGESEWSMPAHWSIGLIHYLDWKGRWIGLDRAFPWDNETAISRLSARYFRKEFAAPAAIKKAKLYIIGLGLYEAYINGQRIGDQVLAPVPTDYTKGIKYNVFDVTAHLQQGNNAIGVTLGNGRYYAMRQNYKPYKIKNFGYPKMLMQLEITYADGKTDVIETDDTWKATADGPIRTNNEYDGEEYDATKELTAWNKTGYNDSKWLKAELVQEPGGDYEAQMTANMKVMETIKPVAIKKLDAKRYVLDLGQNMAGWLKLKASGKKGDTLQLRFAETLQKNGELYVANLRDARSTDRYIFKGAATEEWHPSFVYHGFRYVEITGYNGTPTLSNFEGQVVYDEMQTTGSFQTSDSVINGIYKNAYWGIRSNYKGMPVDCPQRNERQPWLGDRSAGAYGESFIFDNSRLYAKWLDDIEQAQKWDGSIPDVAPAFWRYYGDNVTWPGTYLNVADMLYHQFADARPIRKHYASMKKWINYMYENYMKDGLMTKDKYGDWCVPPEALNLIHSRDSSRITDGELLATATYYHCLTLMQKFAAIANQPEDIKGYASLAEKMKDAFNKKFLNHNNFQYSNNTVTANILPLSYAITNAEESKKVFLNVVNKMVNENSGHISTGVIGTQWLMRSLTNNGRPDLAYQLTTNTTYPGWGYMLKNGATTIWELWNGNTADPAMNSGNHVMLLGDLIIWYYENLAGIQSGDTAPGFKQIIMKPSFVNGLNFVNASYQSVYGTIKSNWRKEGNLFTWNITIPPNTTALVYLPASSKNEVLEGGKKAGDAQGITFKKIADGKVVFEIGSGNYSFSTIK